MERKVRQAGNGSNRNRPSARNHPNAPTHNRVHKQQQQINNGIRNTINGNVRVKMKCPKRCRVLHNQQPTINQQPNLHRKCTNPRPTQQRQRSVTERLNQTNVNAPGNSHRRENSNMSASGVRGEGRTAGCRGDKARGGGAR